MQKSQGFEEKQIAVHGLEVNYKIEGSGPSFLILHGWGSSSNTWQRVQEQISASGFWVIVPDLPGFGRTAPPKDVWGVHEYANFVFDFMDSLGIQKVMLAGHSFGGQVAVQCSLLHPERIEKLVLIAPAAVRHKPTLQNYVLKYAAKAIGVILYVVPRNIQANIKHAGYVLLHRRDYVMAYGVMRNVFKKLTQEDLSSVLKDIKTPTLLVWGTKDSMTPIADGKFMAEQIPGATLEVFPENGHNFHTEAPQKLAETILKFLRSQKM